MKIRQGFTFDDVLLVPQHSDIPSRGTISIETDLGKDIHLSIPVISANMKDVTEVDMAKAIASFGGLPILHRFAPIDYQLKMLNDTHPLMVGCSVGIKEHDYDNALAFIDKGCSILCVDVAHGDHALSLKIVEKIAKNYPGILLIAGNVATAGGAKRLYDSGANVIKVGMGPGSLCTTRIETGNGVPQMTALEDVYNESFGIGNSRKFKIIADGGIRSAGDIVKALCFSDAVMLGSLLAGTDETPGAVDLDASTGQRFKQYAGSSTHKANRVEGVVRRVHCKGPVKPIITKLMEGVQSGLSYQGCRNLNELRENPEFVLLSAAGLVESHPHSH